MDSAAEKIGINRKMPLRVIDQLEVLVLIDNKTDSLSSIPQLISGKTQTLQHRH